MLTRMLFSKIQRILGRLSETIINFVKNQFKMKVFLENVPKGFLSESQRKNLIKDAKEFGADYLAFATEFDDKCYFLYGLFKDKRPRFSGIPRFVCVDGEKIEKLSYSLCIFLAGKIDTRILNLSSND